jgi:hypothetical protein
LFLLALRDLRKSSAAGSDRPAIGNLQSIASPGLPILHLLMLGAASNIHRRRSPIFSLLIFCARKSMRAPRADEFNIPAPACRRACKKKPLLPTPQVCNSYFLAARRTSSIICVRFLPKKNQRVCAPQLFILAIASLRTERDPCKNHQTHPNCGDEIFSSLKETELLSKANFSSEIHCHMPVTMVAYFMLNSSSN